MSCRSRRRHTSSHPLKERTSMSKRIAGVTAMLSTILLLFVLPLASASASAPWWQVLAGSRPANLWKASDNVQELEVQTVELFPGFSGAAIGVEVRGEVVGCLGTGLVGSFLCPALTTFAPEETASELEATLKTALGTEAVEVTGGPVGAAPLTVVVHGSGAPAIGLEPVTPSAGVANAKVLSQGGSGRLVLTLTNLGDAEVDATGSLVTVVDHLPEGVVATGVEGFAGAENEPVECAVEAPMEVSCKFEGKLPPYEGLEVE